MNAERGTRKPRGKPQGQMMSSVQMNYNQYHTGMPQGPTQGVVSMSQINAQGGYQMGHPSSMGHMHGHGPMGQSSSSSSAQPPSQPVSASTAEVVNGFLGTGILPSGRNLRTDYHIEYPVGEGTYGIVCKAKRNGPNPMQVAIKKCKSLGKDGEGIPLSAIREIMLLREVTHENVVKLQEIILNYEDRTMYLVLDYAEYDLSEMIKYHREVSKVRPPDSCIKSCLWQMLRGIEYLHQSWIMHRDIKPSNILVMGEGPEVGVVKIADFGLARLFQQPLRPLSDNGIVVTIWYRAPELLLGAHHYGPAIDIWAIGCIFAEMYLKKPLFQGNPDSVDDQILKTIEILGIPTPEVWPNITHLPDYPKLAAYETKPNCYRNNLDKYMESTEMSPVARDLLARMLDYDPERRITATDALRHPYFTEERPPLRNAFEGMRLLYPRRSVKKVSTAN